MKPRALVIRLSSLGDVVLATAVLDPLVAAGYEVSFATKASFAPLLEHHPRIKSIFRYGEMPTESESREAFFQWLEAQNFDLIIDLQDSLRTKIWRRKLRSISKLCVVPKPRWNEILVLLFRMKSQFGLGRGGRARYFRQKMSHYLISQGHQISTSVTSTDLTELRVTDDERNQARSLVGRDKFIAVFPSSAWSSKEWMYFDSLALKWRGTRDFFFLGGSKDTICDELANKTGGRSLRGQTSLRESMAIVANAEWVIGNDTGFLHVAEALQKSVLMIEGPTHAALGFSSYRGESVVAGKDLWCRPCSKSGKFCYRWGSRACLKQLSADEVWAMVPEEKK